MAQAAAGGGFGFRSTFRTVTNTMLPFAVMWYFSPDPPEPPKHHATPWLDAGEQRPWARHEFDAEQLDLAGHVFRLPNFLSGEEVSHVLSTVAPAANFTDDSPTQRQAYVVGAALLAPPSSQRYRDAAEYVKRLSPLEQEDQTLFAIEERIAELTGVPFHDHELPLQLARIRAIPIGPAERPYLPSGGLQHDVHMRPKRVATVYVYLNSGTCDLRAGAEECAADGTTGRRCEGSTSPSAFCVDGGTDLFPCVRPHGARITSAASLWPARSAAMCERLEGHFKDRGHRYFAHPDSERGESSRDPEAATQASEMCVDEEETGALRVEPRAGDALLFLSVEPDEGEAITSMWHTTCQVGDSGHAKRLHPPAVRSRSPTVCRPTATRHPHLPDCSPAHSIPFLRWMGT